MYLGWCTGVTVVSQVLLLAPAEAGRGGEEEVDGESKVTVTLLASEEAGRGGGEEAGGEEEVALCDVSGDRVGCEREAEAAREALRRRMAEVSGCDMRVEAIESSVPEGVVGEAWCSSRLWWGDLCL
jgi:hypothetical protein